MNAIRSVFTAFANLAQSINGLAAVIDAATGRLRQQIPLDGEPTVLEHQPVSDASAASAGSNGTAKRRR